jgi:hypothetical protein
MFFLAYLLVLHHLLFGLCMIVYDYISDFIENIRTPYSVYVLRISLFLVLTYSCIINFGTNQVLLHFA